MLCCSWNMAHDRCNCYFSFWAIFCPFTPITARRYYHFTQVYQKSRSYDLLFLRYGKRHMQLLVFMLGYFSPVYPAPFSPSLLTAQKIKIKKKMKKIPGHFIILHKCTKDHDHMLYCSWDMARDGCNCYFSFWPIFLPFYYCNRPKISLFYTIVPKIMIIGYTFPEICMARDVCNCFFSF